MYNRNRCYAYSLRSQELFALESLFFSCLSSGSIMLYHHHDKRISTSKQQEQQNQNQLFSTAYTLSVSSTNQLEPQARRKNGRKVAHFCLHSAGGLLWDSSWNFLEHAAILIHAGQ